jgi:hypothetical protein
MVHNYKRRSRDSTVGITTGWTARVRFPAVQNISLLYRRRVETEPGAHSASYPMGTGDPFSSDKEDGA